MHPSEVLLHFWVFQYPEEVPDIVVRNPRGLGEEEIQRLVALNVRRLRGFGCVWYYLVILFQLTYICGWLCIVLFIHTNPFHAK